MTHISSSPKIKWQILDFLDKNTFLGNFNVIRIASLLLNFRSLIKSMVLWKRSFSWAAAMQNLCAAQWTVRGKSLQCLLAVSFSCSWSSNVLRQSIPRGQESQRQSWVSPLKTYGRRSLPRRVLTGDTWVTVVSASNVYWGGSLVLSSKLE